mmetsp:Transcript_55058/g.108735  ORF Transcript_55058/g.108735 Transcript_55058/m.108735 type:complete len:200 (-) Transcript_55058:61-660(-)
MTQGKEFGNYMSIVLVCVTMVVLGTLGLTFALLYKITIYGYCCPGNEEVDEREPQPPPMPQTSSNSSGVAQTSIATVPEEGDIESNISEVAAIVIPIKMKVPKHGRVIVTPRATELGNNKVVVDAVVYESDMEHDVANAVSTSATTSITHIRQTREVVLDSRAPQWYNDDADNSGSTNVHVRQTREVMLDSRAPDWYND